MLELLRELLHRKPFRPIRVVMKSGERYDILDRGSVAIAKTKAFLFLPPRCRMTELAESNIELIYQPRERVRKFRC